MFRKTFLEKIRAQERNDFPEFKYHPVYEPEDKSWVYFSPFWHFNSELLTEPLVEDIRTHQRHVLTVGSGPAHLERFLIKHLGISPEQITLSDKETILPSHPQQYLFDMYQPWPAFPQPFDYILFPESALLDIRKDKQGIPHHESLETLLRHALSALHLQGQIRMTGIAPCPLEIVQSVQKQMQVDYPALELDYSPALITARLKVTNVPSFD